MKCQPALNKGIHYLIIKIAGWNSKVPKADTKPSEVSGGSSRQWQMHDSVDFLAHTWAAATPGETCRADERMALVWLLLLSQSNDYRFEKHPSNWWVVLGLNQWPLPCQGKF
jgi:hypothetical protein